MKTVRLFVLALAATLFALPLLAAPQIAVYRNWDNVQVNKNDLVDFGDAEVGVPISRLFRIENHGDQTLSLNPYLGSQSIGFSIITAPAMTVPPGGSTTMRIRLFTNEDGRYYGYVNIGSNDPVTPLFYWTVTGYVHGPKISVYQAATGVFQPDGSTFDYGTHPYGSATYRTFRIVNSGTRNLVISNSNSMVGGAGFVQSGSGPYGIAPGGYGDVTVVFAPGAPGLPWNGDLHISNNDPLRGYYQVLLKGQS
jgi:hypothetical protein